MVVVVVDSGWLFLGAVAFFRTAKCLWLESFAKRPGYFIEIIEAYHVRKAFKARTHGSAMARCCGCGRHCYYCGAELPAVVGLGVGSAYPG